MDLHRGSIADDIVEGIVFPIAVFLWKAITMPFVWIARIAAQIVKDVLLGVYGKFIGLLVTLLLAGCAAYFGNLFN